MVKYVIARQYFLQPILAPVMECNERNCKDTTKKKWMELYCRSTCGLCAMPQVPDPLRPNCVDKINCGPFRKVCKDPIYVEEMKKSCARTCEYCDIVANITTTANPILAGSQFSKLLL